MTREEAIVELHNCIELIRQDGQDFLDERDLPLLDMAIEALQVDLVRCGECIYRDCCSELGDEVDADDYCSFGERRSDDTN